MRERKAKERRRSTKGVVAVLETRGFDLTPFVNDFPAFAANLDILPKDSMARGRIKLLPTSIQSEFEAARTGRDIVLKPRQVGLTTWELARDVWKFVCGRGQRVVIVVQSSEDDDQLKDVSNKLRIMFESLEALGLKLPFRGESVSEWLLGDSSLRIVVAGASEASAQKKGRGGTIARLHITELAFFEYAGVTLNALLECVPATGEIVIESTANGASGVFHERYQAAKLGKGGYKAHFFKWTKHAEYATPLVANEVMVPETEREKQLVHDYEATLEQLKWYRAKVQDKGQDLVDQEYPIDEATCWLSAGRMFFDRERCVALQAATVPPAFVEIAGALFIWKRAELGRTYVIAADPSEGTGGDPGAAVVLDRATGEHVATLHGQFPPWRFAELLDEVGALYGNALVVVERNLHGHAVLQALLRPPVGRRVYPNIFKGTDGKHGWYSTEIARSAALDALEDALRQKRWGSPDGRVIGELFTFVVTKSGKAEGAPGSHDDLVMASAIGHDVCRKPLRKAGQQAPAVVPGGDYESRTFGVG